MGTGVAIRLGERIGRKRMGGDRMRAGEGESREWKGREGRERGARGGELRGCKCDPSLSASELPIGGLALLSPFTSVKVTRSPADD